MAYVDSFLVWLTDDGKDEKTITAYRTVLAQFSQWLEGTKGAVDFTEIKPIDVKDYVSYLRHNLGRKQATINKSIAALKTFFGYLSEQGNVSSNPMTRIKLQKIQSAQTVGQTDTVKWLTKLEQEKLVSYIDLEKNEFKRLRNFAIVDLMLYAGLRVHEVQDLKIDDIHVNGDVTITIREGKMAKFATVTLIDKRSKNLRNWLKCRRTLTKEVHMESPYLFVSERSEQFCVRGIEVMLDKYAEQAHIENMTPHRLRHSFAKNLANSGAGVEVIRRLARHESIQTTMVYLDTSRDEELSALRKL